MSNVYSRVLAATGLNRESQGDGYQLGALWTLLSSLSVLEEAHPTDNVHVNDIDELLQTRLAAYRDTKFIKEFVRPFLNQYHEKFAS